MWAITSATARRRSWPRSSRQTRSARTSTSVRSTCCESTGWSAKENGAEFAQGRAANGNGPGRRDGYPHLGDADYTDPVVDPAPAPSAFAGSFPIPAARSYPGQFVRVRLPIERRENALLVPSRALGSDQAGEYLLVVGKDNVVERRR